MIDLKGMAGTVTVVTGFEKGSGKTTFLNLAMPCLREEGPVAAFSIGVDGSLKAREAGAVAPEIHVAVGDVVLTTEPFARMSDARFEVLEALPGRTALGRLMVGRVVRPGSVTLVGPEHFSLLAETLERVRREGWAQSMLVDGSVNRVTQVSALGDVRFVFTVRVDRVNLARAASRVKAMAELAALPEEAHPDGLRHEGPFTATVLKALPEGTAAVSIEDFTKVFLEPSEWFRALSRYRFTVRKAFELFCISVTLRDVTRDEFLAAIHTA